MHNLTKVSYLVMLFRKIATILLLSFLFFNWVGYWLFISWFESHAETLLESRLEDGRYDRSQLILVKISADHLPYCNASTAFDREGGKVDIGNLHYRYVGKRLYNDSVEFLCLPDREANRFRDAKNNFFSLINDLQNTGHSKVPGASGKIASNALKVCFPVPHGLTVNGFPVLLPRLAVYTGTTLPPGHSCICKRPPRPDERL
jgi:hypothetical protein